MENVSCPISLRLGNHHYNGEKRDPAFPFGTMRGILFNSIRASVLDEAALKTAIASLYTVNSSTPRTAYPGEERQCISICGIPGHPVEGVALSDVHVTYPGGGTREDSARRDLPELEDQYPEYFMWGVLPAYGLYARHAKGLSLNNVRFDLARPDARPAITCDDVEDLNVCDVRAAANPDTESLLRLRSTRDALIHGCRPLGKAGTFLRVEGRACRDITLHGNDLHRARKAVETADGADARAVSEKQSGQ
jgi:hypothetical protein